MSGSLTWISAVALATMVEKVVLSIETRIVRNNVFPLDKFMISICTLNLDL
jgi:hypothetical protein